MAAFLLNKNQKGLSLIEVLVSITVLVVGILTIVSLITSNMRDSRQSEEKFVAINLSQEGLELMRNYRDSIWKDGKNMSHYSGTVFKTGQKLTVDILEPAPTLSSAKPIYLNPSNPQYTHKVYSGAAKTPYSRVINIDKVDLDGLGNIKSVTISSKVTWSNHDVILTQVLYDWSKP